MRKYQMGDWILMIVSLAILAVWAAMVAVNVVWRFQKDL